MINKKSGLSLARAYLFTDITVLLLSLIYIPVVRLFFSFVTTLVSSFLIGQFEVRVKRPAMTQSMAKHG